MAISDYAITAIILVRSVKKMFWVDARWRVTSMTTDVWKVSMVQKETKAVRSDLFAIDLDGPVTFSGITSPQPAPVSLSNLRPKPLNTGIFIHVNSLSVG
jgi:hypothetical protein